MFEKEAEKYAENNAYKYASDYITCQEAYKDGAEFGYNKANEWHFVKDNDLPKKENLECLCIIRPVREEGKHFENKDFRGVLYFRNGRFYLDEDTSNDWLKETNSDFTELVIAWQEIVLPEEVMTQEEKTMFNQWLCLNGGEEGSLYMTFSDEELEQIFLTAIEVYEKNKK